MDVETNKAIGRCLRDVRKARHLQQRDVAAAMGRPQSFVSKLENGERKFVLAGYSSDGGAKGKPHKGAHVLHAFAQILKRRQGGRGYTAGFRARY